MTDAAELPGRHRATIGADHGCFRDPVFVFAPQRSYTTVCVALLAGHPELYGLPETNLFLRETVGEILAMPGGPPACRAGHRHHLMGLERALAQLHDASQDGVALDRALGWLQQRAGTPAAAVMEHVLRLVHPRIGVEKSPATVASVQALARCLHAFPGARYLHLTRHPADTQRSMLKIYSQYPFPPGMPHAERVRLSLLTWYASHARIVQALQAVPQPRWLRVRAEDLAGAPRTWLPRVLDWLDLGYDEAIIDRMLDTGRWEFARWRGSVVYGGADPYFLRDPALRPVPSPRHQVIDPSWEIEDDIAVKVTALARYLGY